MTGIDSAFFDNFSIWIILKMLLEYRKNCTQQVSMGKIVEWKKHTYCDIIDYTIAQANRRERLQLVFKWIYDLNSTGNVA